MAAAIEQAYRQELQEVAARVMEEAIKQLQDEMARKMDALALKVVQFYSVSRHEDRIIITVHKPEDIINDRT